MSKYIAEKMINMTNGISTNNDKKNILILGLTFKENCPDIRNTKVVDVINSFSKSKYLVDVYDPWAKSTEAEKEYGIKLIDRLESNKYDGIILCVSHREFKEMGIDKIKSLGKNEHILFDLKSVFDKDQSDFRL
jgi:UDP-N-acetyl-D-galactosamine dehydrogenase